MSNKKTSAIAYQAIALANQLTYNSSLTTCPGRASDFIHPCQMPGRFSAQE